MDNNLYNCDWEKYYVWLRELKDNVEWAACQWCNSEFELTYGEQSVVDHERTDKHVEYLQNAPTPNDSMYDSLIDSVMQDNGRPSNSTEFPGDKMGERSNNSMGTATNSSINVLKQRGISISRAAGSMSGQRSNMPTAPQSVPMRSATRNQNEMAGNYLHGSGNMSRQDGYLRNRDEELRNGKRNHNDMEYNTSNHCQSSATFNLRTQPKLENKTSTPSQQYQRQAMRQNCDYQSIDPNVQARQIAGRQNLALNKDREFNRMRQNMANENAKLIMNNGINNNSRNGGPYMTSAMQNGNRMPQNIGIDSLLKQVDLEVGHVYKCVKNNKPYSWMDYTKESVSPSNTNIIEKLASNVAKCAKYAAKFLGPRSLDDLRMFTYISVHLINGNSELGNQMPIVIQSFHPETGITFLAIGIVEACDADVDRTFDLLTDTLNKLEISYGNISGFCAGDNTKVNYDNEHSVYTLLKEKSVTIQKMPSVKQIVFDSAKSLMNAMDLEIENLIRSIFECADLCEVVPELKSHMDTVMAFFDEDNHKPKQWLTIKPAVDIILQQWLKLKVSITCIHHDNKNAIDVAIQSTLLENEDQTKIYLYFLSEILILFEFTQKQMQSSTISIIDVHASMSLLKNRLEYRICENAYGSVIAEKLNSFNGSLKQKCLHTFAHCIEIALDYLQDNYDFESDSIGGKLEKLNLRLGTDGKVNLPQVGVLLNLIDHFQIPGINTTDLTHEIEFNNKLSVTDAFQKLSIVDKWREILLEGKEYLKELNKLMQFIFSLPVSLEFTERMVEIIDAKKQIKGRQELTLDTLNTEVLIHMNTDEIWNRVKYLKGKSNFDAAVAISRERN